ncbi:GlcG/HbpS family heme-binding protein [Rhodoligotrophos ferricapiens]|uniref:GlcG/HbpS family heme-binding protein n=1 Tax=Rhodoligotrophos ferricapiens TaxID=3069264 RepID=UPI00315DCF18
MLDIKRLSIEDARLLIKEAVEASNAINVPMCIAVADESGYLIAFERMNGGKTASISIAMDKAFTAATARRATHVYNENCVPGKPSYGIHNTNGGRFCIVGGGLPVTADGVVVGAIGISSGTAAEDQQVGEAALKRFYEATGYQP